MTPYQHRLNRYISRMAKDMKIRNMAQSTIDSYTWHVTKFCEFFDSPPEDLGPEEIRQYQLYMIEQKKSSWSSFNQAVCGLRFLYEVSLKRHWAVRHIPFGKRPKTLPVVLSDEEAIRLIQCVDNPKHRMVLLTCYATGMRLREATNLRVADVDGDRQQIRITLGKGSKERLVPASPRLLEELREYWKLERPRNYFFPGMNHDTPLSSATVQKACKLGVAKAQINKPATPHTMRHTFATSMLEAGVDLLTISKLLGHASFVTTMIYLHVRRQHFDRSPSPIDWMPVRQCPQWAEVDPVVQQPPTIQQELTQPQASQPAEPRKEATQEEQETQEAKKTKRRTSGHSQGKKRNKRRRG
ncbi:MAG: site-specific integrase [Pirellulaceae bacterium]